MLEILLNINPGLYNQLINSLIGVTRDIEKIYNRPKNSMGFRYFQPDDTFSGATSNQWKYTYTALCAEHLFGNVEESCVLTRQAIVYLGWICDTNLGDNGYLEIKINNATRSNLDAKIVYNQQHPQHIYFDIQKIITAKENDLVDCITYNDNSFDVFGEIHPIIYIICDKQRYLDINAENILLDDIPTNLDVAKKEIIDNQRLQSIEDKLALIAENYQNPLDYVPIKDTPFSEHYELRAKTIPSTVKNLLEGLDNNLKICRYCGSKSSSGSLFCQYCGIPLDYTKEKQILHKKLN